LLSVTANNATANSIMINKLSNHTSTFPGQANCTCCFDHILNLVVKSLLCLFD
ncbi:hypothetical protein OBBRIDRAFT_693613, partial [Obba rivulosa]